MVTTGEGRKLAREQFSTACQFLSSLFCILPGENIVARRGRALQTEQLAHQSITRAPARLLA
jgi:hypothetical protein